MEENNKVIIFEKKEIILVLIFVIVLIITSFTLGIRLGKKLAFDASGITKEDIKTIDLKSSDEEQVEKTINEESKLSDDDRLKKLMDESKGRLSDELGKFSSENKDAGVDPSVTAASPNASELQSKMEGQFTIQLGSYNNMDEAKLFAEGFTVRGYSPLIQEVIIDGKGTWYRVSLGMFDTIEAAKAYIRSEQSLFKGQDHVITEMK